MLYSSTSNPSYPTQDLYELSSIHHQRNPVIDVGCSLTTTNRVFKHVGAIIIFDSFARPRFFMEDPCYDMDSFVVKIYVRYVFVTVGAPQQRDYPFYRWKPICSRTSVMSSTEEIAALSLEIILRFGISFMQSWRSSHWCMVQKLNLLCPKVGRPVTGGICFHHPKKEEGAAQEVSSGCARVLQLLPCLRTHPPYFRRPAW